MAQEDTQGDAATDSTPDNTPSMEQKGEPENLGKMTFFGRIVVFLVLPTIVGFVGLYLGYLETRNDSSRKLSFDQDFALPFALTLAMCIVIGFQTSGFSSKQAKPLVAWPKVKKRRKIIHKHVVKGQSIEEDEDDQEESDKKND
eukprot:Nitzschia sp. Nitz4//scaffold64_size103689//48728//49159//NITZ4_004435-RA/size103689-processed-gene-0.101-mRNA-1//-1//CDS//3329556127//2432//frame0